MFADEKVVTPASKNVARYYGAKVLYADTYHELIQEVNQYENNKDACSNTGVLKGWSPSSMSFMIEDLPGKVFDFIYVLENPPIYQDRAYTGTKELFEDFLEKFPEACSEYCKPLIWIREIDTKKDFLIVSCDTDTVTIIDSKKVGVGPVMFGGINPPRSVLAPVELNMTMLAARFTFLDGSGCCIREIVK